MSYYAIRRPKPPNLGKHPVENVKLFKWDGTEPQNEQEATGCVISLCGNDHTSTYQLIRSPNRKKQAGFEFDDDWADTIEYVRKGSFTMSVGVEVQGTKFVKDVDWGKLFP